MSRRGFHALRSERPRVDHSVDRPELYGVRALQVTGTNGRTLDHFYRSPFNRWSVAKWVRYPRRLFDDQDRTNLDQTLETQPGRLETADRVFVGGYARRVTPVPIPNTVVKPAGPMILLQRESRSLPALYKDPRVRKDPGVLFCARPCPKHSQFPPAVVTL